MKQINHLKDSLENNFSNYDAQMGDIEKVQVMYNYDTIEYEKVKKLFDADAVNKISFLLFPDVFATSTTVKQVQEMYLAYEEEKKYKESLTKELLTFKTKVEEDGLYININNFDRDLFFTDIEYIGFWKALYTMNLREGFIDV